jgi:hypothetical protein
MNARITDHRSHKAFQDIRSFQHEIRIQNNKEIGIGDTEYLIKSGRFPFAGRVRDNPDTFIVELSDTGNRAVGAAVGDYDDSGKPEGFCPLRKQ